MPNKSIIFNLQQSLPSKDFIDSVIKFDSNNDTQEWVQLRIDRPFAEIQTI